MAVGPERAKTHDKRVTSLPRAHTQVCARDNKSVTCLETYATAGPYPTHTGKNSVTKLCPVGRRTQPITPINTQTISLSGHHFPFHHLYFPSDNITIIYFLSLASDK